VVVIGSGGMWCAVRPLTRTDKGRNAPIHLVEKQGDLVLEIYNYLGPKKAFWEMRPRLNPFFQGHPQCGVYIEMAEQSDYPDGKSFAWHVASGTLRDEADLPFTTDFAAEHLWTVEYERDGQKLGIEIDLMDWQLKRRWTQDGEQGWPMLESPAARQTVTGEITIGDATLSCGDVAAWLYANPVAKRWVAGYHGQTAAPLTLILPDGVVEIEAMGMGTVIWDDGDVTIEAIDLTGTPQITNGWLAT
jgi:hypothetical protein